MRFSCERCGKGYVTKDVPLPGRIYRLKCKACGNILVVKGGDPASAPAKPDPAPSEPASPIPSAVTPLADLAAPAPTPPPAATPASPPPAAEPPASSEAAPAPATPGEPRYIELFDEKDFASEGPPPGPPASAVPPPAARPTAVPPPVFRPTIVPPPVVPPPVPDARHAPATEPVRDAPPPAPGLGLTEEEFREAAETLRQSFSDEHPFEKSRDPFAPAAPEDEAPAPLASPLAEALAEPEPPRPAPPPAQALVVRTARHPAARPRRRGLAVLLGSLAVVVLLAGAGLVFFRGRPAGTGSPAPRPTAVARASSPTPPPATPTPAPAPAPSPTERESPAAKPGGSAPPAEAQPAVPPPEPPATAAAAPPEPPAEAAQPPRHAAPKASPPPRPPPPKAAEKPRPAKPGKPAERVEPKVAAAERPEPAPAPAPAPAAATAPPPPAPAEPAEPTGLTPEQIQRALGGGRKAFDACLRDPSRGLDQPLGARQVTLRFTVSPEGTVGYATIDDVTISGAPVGQCLKAAARGLSFPSFQGDPVKVDAPINIPAR